MKVRRRRVAFLHLLQCDARRKPAGAALSRSLSSGGGGPSLRTFLRENVVVRKVSFDGVFANGSPLDGRRLAVLDVLEEALGLELHVEGHGLRASREERHRKEGHEAQCQGFRPTAPPLLRRSAAARNGARGRSMRESSHLPTCERSQSVPLSLPLSPSHPRDLATSRTHARSCFAVASVHARGAASLELRHMICRYSCGKP